MSLLLLFHPRSLVTVRKYILNGTSIKSPFEMMERNSVIYALQRTLSGNVMSDQFNGKKRQWQLNYKYLTQAQYATILSQYEQYLEDEQPVTWEIRQDNYSVASTDVHVDLDEREFNMPGSDYYSDITLILTEA